MSGFDAKNSATNFCRAQSSRNIFPLMSKTCSWVFSALKHVVKRVKLRTAKQRFGTAPLPRRSVVPHSLKNPADPGQPKDRRYPSPRSKIFPARLSTPRKYFCLMPFHAKKISGSTQFEAKIKLPQLSTSQKNQRDPHPEITIHV